MKRIYRSQVAELLLNLFKFITLQRCSLWTSLLDMYLSENIYFSIKKAHSEQFLLKFLWKYYEVSMKTCILHV